MLTTTLLNEVSFSLAILSISFTNSSFKYNVLYVLGFFFFVFLGINDKLENSGVFFKR